MTIQLNAAGLRYARSLISSRKVNKTAAWSFSAADGNALLGDKGDDWPSYGRAHLAIDSAATDDTKARYAYPVVKGDTVYRAGVIAAKQRAGQQKDGAIETAAGELLDMIDEKEGKSAPIPGLELRAGGAPMAQGGKIAGYAALFNSQADIGGMFREQIAPGAFADTIGAGDDVRALFNHDPNHVLGRTANGTLTLSEDSKGLRFEVTPPEAGWARDLMASIERGDINQCSFGFMPVAQEWDESGATPLRTLRKVKLFDVSAVTFPAYGDTSCAVRSLDAWREAHAAPPEPFNPFPVRARLLKARLDRQIRA